MQLAANLFTSFSNVDRTGIWELYYSRKLDVQVNLDDVISAAVSISPWTWKRLSMDIGTIDKFFGTMGVKQPHRDGKRTQWSIQKSWHRSCCK